MADGVDTAEGVLQDHLVNVTIDFEGVDSSLFEDFSLKEVIMAESLLTPGLQTSITGQNYIHKADPVKIFDVLKGQNVKFKIERKILEKANQPSTLEFQQVIYRLGGRSSTNPNTTDNRKQINRAVEELTFHACDQTLLNDAATLVSKSWKCTTPTQVTGEVLAQCAGVPMDRMVLELSDPARDYIAENIRPFQVVTQQANAALAAGNDPSFLHFMTYPDVLSNIESRKSGTGIHHFRSLHTMAQQQPVGRPLQYGDAGNSYFNPYGIMHYVFPCDFDFLSDILNGVGMNGNISSVVIFNPATKLFDLTGNQDYGCGVGGGEFKISMSNFGSEKSQNMCPDFVSTYLKKRQARMSLLEKDKIALRITVPWNPIYNVGKVIQVKFINEEDLTGQTENYGSGKYLIVALIHNIKNGGYGTITMDCVSESVAHGEV